MSDTTQRLCTNHIVRFRSFLVYILYGFLQTDGANSWGPVLVCWMQLS